MTCYVCGHTIKSDDHYFKNGTNTRHSWHGEPGHRPYITVKPTLRDAFQWAEHFDIVILKPSGFDPWRPGQPRLSDMIDEATFNKAKLRSTWDARYKLRQRFVEERNVMPMDRGTRSIGPLDRGR